MEAFIKVGYENGFKVELYTELYEYDVMGVSNNDNLHRMDENIDEPDYVSEEYDEDPENIDFHVEGEQDVRFSKQEGGSAGSTSMGRGSQSMRGGFAWSTVMDRASRSKRDGSVRKGYDDINNTEENQIIKDKDAMHEVMQEVMDEEERLNAEREQRLDL
ncbi:hypothetical protein Tco_0668492 [Tanacetum coccineum]